MTEAGCVAECGISGKQAIIDLDNPMGDAWCTFQARDRIGDANMLVRCEWKMPKVFTEVDMGDDFVLKLFGDEFWENEYQQRGAVALVPESIADICRAGNAGTYHKAYRFIPLSIRDLFRKSDRSYARRLYAGSTNPDRELRDRTVLYDIWG